MSIIYEVHPTHQQTEAAKRILCGIIQLAGGTFSSQTRLHKAFYWAHLYFWQHANGVLTSYPMTRMPYGPGIEGGEDLLFEMQSQGLLEVDDPNPEDERADRAFRLLSKFKVNLNASEMRSIRHALEKVAGKSSEDVSEETRASSRSWRRRRNGQILNIYEDLLSEEEFQRMMTANADASKVVDDIFS